MSIYPKLLHQIIEKLLTFLRHQVLVIVRMRKLQIGKIGFERVMLKNEFDVNLQ